MNCLSAQSCLSQFQNPLEFRQLRKRLKSYGGWENLNTEVKCWRVKKTKLLSTKNCLWRMPSISFIDNAAMGILVACKNVPLFFLDTIGNANSWLYGFTGQLGEWSSLSAFKSRLRSSFTVLKLLVSPEFGSSLTQRWITTKTKNCSEETPWQ